MAGVWRFQSRFFFSFILFLLYYGFSWNGYISEFPLLFWVGLGVEKSIYLRDRKASFEHDLFFSVVYLIHTRRSRGVKFTFNRHSYFFSTPDFIALLLLSRLDMLRGVSGSGFVFVYKQT